MSTKTGTQGTQQVQVSCSQCHSHNVICIDEYDTDGYTTEWVLWKHECRDCGHVDREITQTCNYGFGEAFNCPFPGCQKQHQM